jgi:hypothetical protein
MSGYMVTTITYGVKEFYMVNSDDPDRACEEVLRATGGKLAQALTPLPDETLAHYKVQPNEPWLCFTADPQPGANIGEGWGIASTAFSGSDLEDVGRGELRLT